MIVRLLRSIHASVHFLLPCFPRGAFGSRDMAIEHYILKHVPMPDFEECKKVSKRKLPFIPIWFMWLQGEQSYENVEILCIDDCSTDGTAAILEEYAGRDSRVRVIRQDSNQGLSVSRNRAIDEARGEYIIMLDGDDLFHPRMVEWAMDKAYKTGADIVMWDFCKFYSEDELPRLLPVPSRLLMMLKNDKKGLLRWPAFMWTKMFRTQWLRQTAIRFTPGLTKQDIPVWWQAVTATDKIAVLPQRLSYYRQNPNNTSNRHDRSVFSLAHVMDITGAALKEKGVYDTFRTEYLRSRLNLLEGMHDFISHEYKHEAMDMIRERFDDDARAYILDPNCECDRRTVWFFKGFLMHYRRYRFGYDGLMMMRSIYRKFRR